MEIESYWQRLWKEFRSHRMGLISLYIIICFILIAIYAPFLASSKPLFVLYDNTPYFPLFRYLFYPQFFTKHLDIFFNICIFTFPLGLVAWRFFKSHPKLLKFSWLCICLIQMGIFLYIVIHPPQNPAGNLQLTEKRLEAVRSHPVPDWNLELQFMTPYEKLNLLLRYDQRKKQHKQYLNYMNIKSDHTAPSTLWKIEQERNTEEIERQNAILDHLREQHQEFSTAAEYAKAKILYITTRQHWLETESQQLKFVIMPLIRSFHWEDDAGGEQSLNRSLSWWEQTRINHKDLVSALIFGTRISIVVGLLSVAISLIIAIPIGAMSGFYGGTLDIILSRLLEVWESMPTFFMLLLIVAITENKSVFLVIAIIGFFGWTGFSRYLRGEFFKQRHLPYVEACRAIGYKNNSIIFLHIFPNAIPPLLTLLPFAIMGAISSEAGLSFLGLGEEGSCSWGVLMDEGRTAFPAESSLLWPPAIVLTLLLIAIAIAGDALRDALDPRYANTK